MSPANDDFTMIFNEHYSGLCRFLDCLVGGREQTAQDLAQESFMRLYRLGPDFLPAGEARFWLYRVARNLALNELKRRHTRNRLLGAVVEIFRQHAPNPEEQLQNEERRALVLSLLKRLPEHQRAALLLREQEAMSYRDIARVLGISESKVKVDI